MKLTLEKVRTLVSNIFGANSAVLQFYVTNVLDQEGMVGVRLDTSGTLYYSIAWWEEFIDTPEKAKHAIAFEIIQKIFADKKKKYDNTGLIALAMVTNSYLYARFGFSELPRAMYSANKLVECLMRVNSKGFNSRFKKLYYGVWERQERYKSVSNVEMALKILLNCSGEDLEEDEINTEDLGEGGMSIPMLGKNSDEQADLGDESSSIVDDLSSTVSDSVVNCLNSMPWVPGGSLPGGKGAEQKDEIEVIKSKESMESEIVKNYVLDEVKAKIKKRYMTKEIDLSPIPIRLSKRDAMRLAMGEDIYFFEQEIDVEREEESDGGIIVYIDVSGSFYHLIGHALGMLETIKEKIDNIYFFSNEVYQEKASAIESKKKIGITSTGGTDFDCIIEHAVLKKFKKIIIFTDGYGDVNEEANRSTAKHFIKDILTIIMVNDPFSTSASYDQQALDYYKATWIGKNYKDCYAVRSFFNGS